VRADGLLARAIDGIALPNSLTEAGCRFRQLADPWRAAMPSVIAGRPVLILMVLGAAIGGCTTSADVSYSRYRFGPGYETEQVYESRVYGDMEQGLGSESCRVVARRQADPFGEISVGEETVCDEF
jgi:hypothetical protein